VVLRKTRRNIPTAVVVDPKNKKKKKTKGTTKIGPRKLKQEEVPRAVKKSGGVKQTKAKRTMGLQRGSKPPKNKGRGKEVQFKPQGTEQKRGAKVIISDGDQIQSSKASLCKGEGGKTETEDKGKRGERSTIKGQREYEERPY